MRFANLIIQCLDCWNWLWDRSVVLDQDEDNKKASPSTRTCSISITSLVSENEFEGEFKWHSFIHGAHGCMYGIPRDARHVVKFDPVDKSITEIGQDLGIEEWKWRRGVLAKSNHCIYCPPYSSTQILKIDTINGTTELLDIDLPLGRGRWISGALAHDGCIYFMPFNGRRILKLNPENDSVCSVGSDLGPRLCKFAGTVLGNGNDGCLYGIPFESRCIIKFDPISETISTIGGTEDRSLACDNGALGSDGNIYALSHRHRKVLKIDVVKKKYFLIGDFIQSSHRFDGWGDAVVGSDRCIYWQPFNANRTVQFDILTQSVSLVGDDFGNKYFKWWGGALSPGDGAIYCIPSSAKQVLSIDPLKEFSMNLKASMEEHPEKLGFLFKMKKGATACDSAIARYGKERVFRVIGDCIPEKKILEQMNLYPFMVAASCRNSTVAVIYHLLRRNPEVAHHIHVHVAVSNDYSKNR